MPSPQPAGRRRYAGATKTELFVAPASRRLSRGHLALGIVRYKKECNGPLV